MELIPPARNATPAAMARSRADTTPEITVGGVAVPWRAVGLAVVLGGSGVLHLVRPGLYEWLVPPELGSARGWVTGSGVAELATATLLAVPSSRRSGGWAAAALLTAFPSRWPRPSWGAGPSTSDLLRASSRAVGDEFWM